MEMIKFTQKLTAIFLVMAAMSAYAEESDTDKVVLDDVVVTGTKLVTPTKQTNETVYTGSEITRDGLDALGSKAAVSVYEAINILPGVTVESIDPYGLAAEQKNIRIRGVRGFLGAMTVAGVPNYGGNPMGPREYLYDMENFDSIAVYKGAVPADLGTGVGARGGAVELRPKWPEEEFGISLSQGIGTNNYRRSFIRMDSGSLPQTGTGLSLSLSHTDAEKWKGLGDLGPRKNLNLMVRQPIPTGDEVKFWFNANDLKQDLYRPLTYGEVKTLGSFYKKDYNSRLTGNKGDDINFYRYNGGEYNNRDFLAELPVTLSDKFRFMFKPYYTDEDTDILQGSGAQGGIIIKRQRDIERYGMITQLNSQFSWGTASLGYWAEVSDMIIRQRNFDPVTFAFKGYGMYMKNDDKGVVHSPFLKLAGSIGQFDWQAGLKYFHYTDPAGQGYIASAPAFNLVAAPDLFREEKTYEEILPTVGMAYRLTDNLELNASYGRNQIRPYAYVPLVNIYNQNRATFQAAGVTLDDMFSGYDMEISDNFEVGARFRHNRFEVVPTLFYSRHQNLLTTVYDPRVNQSYFQNVGDATGYGVEIESNFLINDHLNLFFNPSYTALTYDDDLVFQGAVRSTKDKQVLDTPEWTVKTGLIYTWKDFEVIPMVRYLGTRYGDAEHTEKIDDYVVADLKMGYTFNHFSFVDKVRLSLELINLFDKEYVSVINAMDDSRAGRTSYYVGAPFTAMMTVSFDF
jgi:iron complex outermembrane receptor protein